MAEPIVANWYRDPLGRGEYRYWDGQRWTEHIATSGRKLIDSPIASPPPSTTHRVAEIPPHAGMDDFADVQDGTVSLFRERVLIVKQRTKVIEVKAEYAIYDDSGRPLARVSDVAASFTKRVFNWAVSPQEPISAVRGPGLRRPRTYCTSSGCTSSEGVRGESQAGGLLLGWTPGFLGRHPRRQVRPPDGA